jgi:hypothetical protein
MKAAAHGERTAGPSAHTRTDGASAASGKGLGAGALSLQQRAGNRATARLLGPLSVSHPGDPGEVHAARTAARVLRMPPASAVGGAPLPRPGRDAAASIVPGSAGRALAPHVRAFFEPRLGADLGAVRVHTGPEAARSARALSARACTRGTDVAFGEGAYRPESAGGRLLLAHELTHVLQQAGLAGPRPAPGCIQREREWSPVPCMEQKDALLPGGVGLLTHIHRDQQLLELFGKDLPALEAQIRPDVAARTFVCEAGVPAMVALAATRKGTALDVPAAREALKDHPERFTSSALPRWQQDQRLDEARTRLETTDRWAGTEALKPGVPSVTGIVGLPEPRRADAAAALARLGESLPSVRAAKPLMAAADVLFPAVLAKLEDARTEARKESGELKARSLIEEAEESLDRVLQAVRAANAHRDVSVLVEEAVSVRTAVRKFHQGISPGYAVDTDGLRDLRKSVQNLQASVRAEARKIDAAPESVERLRFVLRYFLALNDPNFADAPTDADVERFRGKLDSINLDLERVFGTSAAGVGELELVERLAERFKLQLDVRKEMRDTTGTATGLTPSLGDVRAYFTALADKPNADVIRAYEAYAGAFYEHQGVSSRQDLLVQGIDELFGRPLSIGGTRGLVCTGYALLGSGLLALAGGRPREFIVAVRASDDQLRSGTDLEDAHALARVTRKGTELFVSNDSIVFAEGDGIGPDAVAWTNRDNRMFTGRGATVRIATEAVERKLEAERTKLRAP